MSSRFSSSVHNIIMDTSFRTKLQEILKCLFPDKEPSVILSILEHHYTSKGDGNPNTLFLPKGYTLEIARDGIYFTHKYKDMCEVNQEIVKHINNYNVHFRRRRKLPRKAKT